MNGGVEKGCSLVALDLNKHGGMVKWLSSISGLDKNKVVSKVFPTSSCLFVSHKNEQICLLPRPLPFYSVCMSPPDE